MQSHVSAARVALPAAVVPEPQLAHTVVFLWELNSCAPDSPPCAPNSPSGPSCRHCGAEVVPSHHNDAVNHSESV